MPRNPTDEDHDAAQSPDHFGVDDNHTVIFEEPVADRLKQLSIDHQIERHLIGGSIFRLEEDEASLAFLLTEVRSLNGRDAVGVIDVDLDPRQDRESPSGDETELPRLKITAIDPLEAHVINEKNGTEVVEPVSSFRMASPFDSLGDGAQDQAAKIEPEPNQTEPDAQTRPDTRGRGSPNQDAHLTEQTPDVQADRSNRGADTPNEPEVEPQGSNGSLPLNMNEEIRALSTLFDGISRSDFWVLDNGNVGVELSMVPTSDAVDRFEILVEYDDSFPEYPPRVWVQKPDLSSDDEAVVEVDHYETREYAEEAGRQIIDGFAGRERDDDEKDDTANQNGGSPPNDRQLRNNRETRSTDCDDDGRDSRRR